MADNDKPAKPDPDEQTPAEKTEEARRLREALKEEDKNRSHKKGGK